MAIRFHKEGFDNAVKIIRAGEIETFDANWEAERPTRDEIIHFIDSHYMREYGLWFLGTDSNFPQDSKEHYVYPYGDLKTVQRCAIIDTINKAQRNNDNEIIIHARELLNMIDKQQKK